MDQPGDLEVQLAEWRRLQTLKVQQLECSLLATQEELSSLRQRYDHLVEDFHFNLATLEDRDRELARYDAIDARVQTVESARQEELSQLRVQVDRFEEQRAREEKEKEEEQERMQHRATKHRLQLEKLQSSMAGDIQKQREEYERTKRDLQRCIHKLEGELALQRQEMSAGFEKELQHREHEFNLRMDEMRATAVAHENKVKLLSKECELQSQACQQATQALDALEQLSQQAHTQILLKEQEITDTSALNDNRIKELENALKRMESNLEKEEAKNMKKYNDLARALRERDTRLQAQQQAFGKLQQDAEKAGAEKRQLQSEHQDALRERDETVQKLRTEVEMTRSGWDKYIKQASKDTVAKDTELQALQDREAKLKRELEKSRQDLERYKQQLSLGLEREHALDQRRVQVELEWQRRCEDLKAEHYLASEGLIQVLTQARNQAQTELKERDRELQEATALLHSVTEERDRLLQGLQLSPENRASEEISSLQQQNRSLRAVVAQMRKDMEGLSGNIQPLAQTALPQAVTSVPSTSGRSQVETGQLAGSAGRHTAQPPGRSCTSRPEVTPEYTQALEQEVSELKAQCRHLEEQLEGATSPANPAPAAVPPPVDPSNAYLQDHIRSLNETIGGLRVEKVSNAATLKKQAVRIAHLEASLASLTQQCHAKQVGAEELHLELANHKRTWASGEAALRQRLATVEMELEESRREKEEFQRGNIINNLETLALGNQVSALKLEIASGREPIVCEESEMVRQLREENLLLRRQQFSLGAPLLQAKLKQATVCIVRLSKKKQQLLEVNNSLCARLIAAGQEVHPSAVRPAESMEPKREGCLVEQHKKGQLSALEQMQYQLTTQELQYAQRELRQEAPVVVRTLGSETDSKGRGQKGAADPWNTARREQRGSKENAPPLSQSQSCLPVDSGSPSSSPSGTLLSPVAMEDSLREVWQILDRGLSPSLLTEGEGPGDSVAPAGPSNLGIQMRVQGVKAPVQNQSQVQESSRPARMASQIPKTSKPGTTSRASKIRNYNVKD